MEGCLLEHGKVISGSTIEENDSPSPQHQQLPIAFPGEERAHESLPETNVNPVGSAYKFSKLELSDS